MHTEESHILIPIGGRYVPVTQWAKVDPEDASLGECRWTLDGNGYAFRYVRVGNSSKYDRERMSRLILGLSHGDPRQGDHINGDPLDNRRSNLRIVTAAQNSQNMASHSDAKSKYRGVDFFRPHGLWRARVCINYKTHDLGYFKTELEAAEAARAFREANMTHNVEARH